MPGPKDFPSGGVVDQPPATAVTVDENLDDAEVEAAAAAEAADGSAAYYAPGESPAPSSD